MGDSGLQPALEASWSRLPRPSYGLFDSSSQHPGPSPLGPEGQGTHPGLEDPGQENRRGPSKRKPQSPVP